MAYVIVLTALDKPYRLVVAKDMKWHLVETTIALKCD
jgi:hypothetical protein